MADNRLLSASGVVLKGDEVLLVRQTYGSAKGLLVIPGGYLLEGEMPGKGLEREIMEETGVAARTRQLISIRFTPQNWWAIFMADYVSGEPVSDGRENSEALFLGMASALKRQDVSPTTREILRSLRSGNGLMPSAFCPEGAESCTYKLYMHADPQDAV